MAARTRRPCARRALLREAGLGAARLYAPSPGLRDARAWLPLDGWRAAHRYFVRHPRPGRHPLRRLQRLGGRLVGLVCAMVGRWPAMVAVAPAFAGTGADTRPWWRRAIPEAGAATSAPEADGWVLLTPGHRDGSRLVALVPGDGGRPDVAVKLARTGESAVRLQAAARAMRRLRALHLDAAGLVPSHRWDPDGTTGSTAGEDAVDGRWLDAELRPRSLARFGDALTTWTIALARATRAADCPAPYDARMRAWVEPFLARFGDAVDPVLRDEALALLRSAGPLPTVCEHRDLRPWNLLVTRRRRLVAVDWDGAAFDGLPLLDLLPAVAFLHFALDGAMSSHAFGRSYRRLLAGPRTLVRLRADALARYADALGLDDASMRVLRVLAWVRPCVVDHDERPPAWPDGHRDWSRTLLPVWEAEARSVLAARGA